MDKKLQILFFTHFTYGMIFNMFGPLIPFMAEQSHQLQSNFTYVFIFRGIAYLISGFAQKGFLSQYNPLKRIMSSCIISGFCFVLFLHFYKNRFISSIICVIMFLANGSMEMLINVLLTSSSTKQAKKAIGFSYGFYGFGGVMGSIMVSVLGTNSLILTAICTITIGIIYMTLFQQPQHNLTQPQVVQLRQKMIMRQSQIIPYNNNQQYHQQISTYLTNQIQMLFCIVFCLYAAISLSYRSWLPSFIVMQHLASKQSAALSISIYSLILTVFRFVFMFWNPDIVKTLHYVTHVLIVTLIASIISYFLNLEIILIYGSSIVLGVIFSSYVPYVYALPSQFGLRFTEQGTCNTIIAYAIGEAVITAFIGCLMNWIHPIMLFIMMLLFSILNIFYISKTINKLQLFNPTIFDHSDQCQSSIEFKTINST